MGSSHRPTSRAAIIVAVSAALAGVLCTPQAASAAARPDLQVTRVSLSASTAAPGDSVSVTVRVRNRGGRAARATRGGLYLSKGRTRAAAAKRLAGGPVARLRARGSGARKVALRVPAATRPGRYRVIACADVTRKVRESSERNNCRATSGFLTVTARAVNPGPRPGPAPGGPPAPVPTPAPTTPPSTTSAVALGACRPDLSISVDADTNTVVEGDTVRYAASVRNDPAGACLGVLGGPTVAGSVDLSTSFPAGDAVDDVAIWIEVPGPAGRDVLPAAAGLTTTGDSGPAACPGDCTATIQNVVGNVAFRDGKATRLAAGEARSVPFRFFPTLSPDDLARIDAAAGAARLSVALTFADGTVAVRRAPLAFADAPTLADVVVDGVLPDGSASSAAAGDLEPGGQADVDGAAEYTTRQSDPDTVTATFVARAGAQASAPARVHTVVTTNPADRPFIFPTASPSAATAGTTATVLVTVSPRGTVAGDVKLRIAGQGSDLGVLRDTGTAGDAVAGDGVYAGTFAVPVSADVQLRVTATLDGVSRTGDVGIDALPAGAPTAPAPDANPQAMAEPGGGQVLRDRIDIRMAGGAPYSAVTAAAAKVAGTVVGRADESGWQRQIPPAANYAALLGVLDSVSRAGQVIGASPVGLAQVSEVVPNDPLYASQYHLPQIGADRAWIVNRGEPDRIVIAVLDTGIDRDHPDLSSRILSGTDLAMGDSNPEDTCGHGTHVAGIAAASTNNGRDVAGVNWNASILPVKVFPDVSGPDQCHAVGTSHVGEAIRWAVDHGASVINMSFGGGPRSEDTVSALQYAWLADRVVVAAAGNTGGTGVQYPAGYGRNEKFSSWFGLSERTYTTDVLAVGNTDSSDKRSASSTHGSWVDVAAPGTGILSTYLAGGTETLTGTSMASPVVAGLASLILSREHTVTEVVRTRLISTGRTINQDVGPRIDAFESVFNGSFEAGLATWTRTGTVEVVNRLGPIAPRAGGRMLSLSTGPGSSQTRATVTKVVPIRADALRDGRITVALDYDYVTEEYPEYVGSQYNDTLKISVRLPSGEVRTLANESVNTTAWTPVTGIDFAGGDQTVGQSGWKSVSTTIPAAALGGTTSFELVVEDVGDAVYDSVALVDSVRVS